MTPLLHMDYRLLKQMWAIYEALVTCPVPTLTAAVEDYIRVMFVTSVRAVV